MSGTPFHDGERLVQKATGEDVLARRNGRFISPTLSANSERMLGVATTLNIAASNAEGHVWSFLANGPEGFVARADDKTVYLNRAEMTVPSALWTMVSASAPIGLVAMDLTSARRFRINGSVREVTLERVTIDVAQTCPNCPKYIQQRLPVAERRYQDVSPGSGSDLPENLADLIRQADTFFVASKHPDGDHDASHRGGYPGFVQVLGNQLVVPDYFGNSMFMTLGNLALEPRAGITFVDFDTGAQLNLTGRATLNLEGRMAHDGVDGRYWTFDIDAWQLAPHRPEPAWKLGGYSRFNPPLET
ncbi:pyridoxamine 5'-phosphate oxidase family protein [Roseovarius mucosus]|uniref:pyridoxamine 5'-phosphate oxidase family protein n=1 Tax=Roseovarius mucosus TaxID=215743 RepID=UPI001C602237|nr:pyridoxamine 5'-phosphate oxidase family protein [Roseovarius mucosus]MBW4976345.1 pyridoxamine 5'-phosphate oxidase family protein [Roseovarius mucosus]MCB1467976.1 pyridoxamine 5'-phosphate oxidase family protein [Rhizobiaceae bacterium]